MKYTKLLAGLLTALIIASSSITVFAHGDNDEREREKTRYENSKSNDKDYDHGYNLSNTNISQALKDAMLKAQGSKAGQDAIKALKEQIKAEYEAQKAIEKANKELYVQAVAKQKQVKGYIGKVAEGKLTYTTEQLSQIDVLSAQLQADVKAVIDISAAIKAAKEAVKTIANSKDYEAILAKLKLETAERQKRGPALTKVNADLDGILAILSSGQTIQ